MEDQHRFDANPDPDSDPTVQFDADPGPDPDWHQHNADPHADHSPIGKYGKIFLLLFTARGSNASLQCFSFHINGKCVMILSILDSMLKF